MNRISIVSRYEALLQDETHNKDVFVIQAKKKFKNIEDVVILHFMSEILDDIQVEQSSAYILFDTIIELDPFEEINARAGELLLDYGKGILFEGDTKCYEQYMEPLKNKDVKNELRNAILMRYLESCEIEEM